jgi:hypothetical protein
MRISTGFGQRETSRRKQYFARHTTNASAAVRDESGELDPKDNGHSKCLKLEQTSLTMKIGRQSMGLPTSPENNLPIAARKLYSMNSLDVGSSFA